MATEDDELLLIHVDPSRLDICKDKKCFYNQKDDNHFGPHKHYLRQCQQHPFCKMEKGTNEISTEDGMPLPRECDYEVPEYLSKADPVYVEFVSRLTARRDRNKLAKQQKLVVTEYSLDHWEAQNQGLDVDRLPATCPKRVPKAMYEALRRKYWGKHQEERKAGKADANSKLQDGEGEVARAEARSGSPSETADKKNLTQVALGQNQEDFAIKKMDQLRPYIYAKSAWVEPLTEKALQRQAEGQKKSAQLGSQAQPAQTSEPTATKGKKGAKNSGSTEPPEGAQTRAKAAQHAECEEPTDISHNQCCRNRRFKSRRPSEKEALQLYRSPYIYGFLQRSEVDFCVDRMKKNRNQKRPSKEEDADQESEADEQKDQPSCEVTVEQERRGQANFITIRRNTTTDGNTADQQASDASLGTSQRAMSTFQKLQMLKKRQKGVVQMHTAAPKVPEQPEETPCHRKTEPPIHRLVRKAAAEIPKNHLEDIKRLKMQEYLLANQNASNGPLGHLYARAEEASMQTQTPSDYPIGLSPGLSSPQDGPRSRNAQMLAKEHSTYAGMRSPPRLEAESPLTFTKNERVGGTQMLVGSGVPGVEVGSPNTGSPSLGRASRYSIHSRVDGDRYKLDQFLQEVNQRQARLNLHIAKANIVGFSQLGASKDCVVSPDLSQRKEVLVRQLKRYRPGGHSYSTRTKTAFDGVGKSLSHAATNAASGLETAHIGKAGLTRRTRTSVVPQSAFRSSQCVDRNLTELKGESVAASKSFAGRGAETRADSRKARKHQRALTESGLTRARRPRRPTIQMPPEVVNSAASHHVVSDQRKLKSILQRIHLGPALSATAPPQEEPPVDDSGAISGGQNLFAFTNPKTTTQYLHEPSVGNGGSSKGSQSGLSSVAQEPGHEPPVIRGGARTTMQTKRGKSLFVKIQDETPGLEAAHSQELDFGNHSGGLNQTKDATATLAKSDRASSKRRASIGSSKRISKIQSHGGQSHAHSLHRKPFITPYEIENELEEVPVTELDRANMQVNVILDLEYPDVSQEPENMFECAEYWLNKGLQAQTGLSPLQVLQASHQSASERKRLDSRRGRQKQDASDQALDFYFQGLRKDPFHFGCCFNVGVTYLQKGMTLNAQKWFTFARLLDPERKEPYLGDAISSLKLGQISRCLQIVRQRPGRSEKQQRYRRLSADLQQMGSDDSSTARKPKNSTSPTRHDEARADQSARQSCGSGRSCQIQRVKLDIEYQFQFLEAITYKKANVFEKSQKEYKKLERVFQARLGERMARYIFTNLMLPMQVDRKVVEDYVQIFLDEVSITDKDAYWDESLHEPLTKIIHFKTQKWENLDKAVLYLADRPLFKRLRQQGYSTEKFKQLVPELSVVVKEAGDIVQSEEGYLYIVMNGRVVLRHHDKDPLQFQYLAQYTAGKVIGHKTLDRGYSLMGQVFPLVVSHKCVLLKVRTKVFDEEIWARAKNKSVEVKINYLRNFPLVQELCDQTLYDIMYESKKILRFKPGDTVLKCHPRSPLSLEGRALYDKEYGSHMKEDVNRAMLNMSEQTMKQRPEGTSTAASSMAKTSAFGSFFAMVNQKKKEREKNQESEEQYYRSFALPKLYTEGRPPESNCRSLALILEGSCRVVQRTKALDAEEGVDEAQLKDPNFLQRHTADVEFRLCELRTGDHFGASDLLRIQDIEYLGDLVAGENGVKVLVIERPDQVIQLCERKILQEKLKSKYDFLKIMLENKYCLGSGAFAKY